MKYAALILTLALAIPVWGQNPSNPIKAICNEATEASIVFDSVSGQTAKCHLGKWERVPTEAGGVPKTAPPVKPTLSTITDPGYFVTGTISIMPRYATFTDKITKDGHYVATLDDPNNEWRCSVASAYNDGEPRVVTIVCVRPGREPVTDERKPAK